MNDKNKIVFLLKTTELLDLWQNFCQMHSDLYDLTCDEYVHLLSSDLESLDGVMEVKNELLEKIKKFESTRQEYIKEIDVLIPLESEKIIKFSDLIPVLKKYGSDNEAIRLEKLNLLLLDIIDKIQQQNKKNQVFLNKAILSLRNLKDSFGGKKNYRTYGANGATSNNSVAP